MYIYIHNMCVCVCVTINMKVVPTHKQISQEGLCNNLLL